MKKLGWLSVALSVILVIVAGCDRGKPQGAATAKDEGPVLAKVGDDVITLNAFRERISGLPENIKAIAESNKAAYLDNLVLEMLLYREGVDRNIDKDKETRALFREAKRKIVVARVAKEEIEDKIKVGSDEISNYYSEHKDEFMSPELLRASHILVDSMQEAVEIKDKLNAGALFEELARKYSKDVTSKRGGDIGYFSAGQMVPEFEEACVRLSVGEISNPVKTQFGYHIIKLTDKKEPELMAFDAVKAKIKTAITTRKRRKLFQDLVARLKTKTDITINNDLLETEVSDEKPPES